MGFLAGLHFWWPKITGRMYPEPPAKVAALLIFVGFFFTFGPQFILGYMGMPRRYAMYPPEWQMLNVMSTAGATVMGFGYLLTMMYFAGASSTGKSSPKTILLATRRSRPQRHPFSGNTLHHQLRPRARSNAARIRSRGHLSSKKQQRKNHE
jgi:heme/copper-type cytochrome/quinol oxidase subunit 1